MVNKHQRFECKYCTYIFETKSCLNEHFKVVHKRRKNRRPKKRNESFHSDVRLVGINCAGISSKLHSFDDLLGKLKPAVFYLQETKVKKQGRINTKKLQKLYNFYKLSSTNTKK